MKKQVVISKILNSAVGLREHEITLQPRAALHTRVLTLSILSHMGMGQVGIAIKCLCCGEALLLCI